MTGITSFTVLHKNPVAREKLGLGFVVGKIEQVTSYQYQGHLPLEKEGQEPILAVITQNKVILKYEVLWENAREISPSVHLSTDLEWQQLTEEFLIDQAAFEEEDETLPGDLSMTNEIVGSGSTEDDNIIDYRARDNADIVSDNSGVEITN